MSWLSRAIRGIGSFLGVTRRDAGRAVLGGVSSALGRRSDRRAAEEASVRDFEEQRALDNLEANQERESLLYRMQLEEWQRQEQRRERQRGAANFSQFSSPIPGFVNRAPVDHASRPAPAAPRINL